MMFGEISLRDNTKFNFGEVSVEIKKDNEYFVYTREGKKVIIVGDKISFLPAPAVGYGVKLMMVRLETPLSIVPHEKIEGFLSVPIEVSVKTGKVEIDRFNVGREKYALYGSLESGVIARYAKSMINKKPVGIGNIKVIIENRTEEWGFVEKIVFPLFDTMYYSEDKAFYPLINVIIEKDLEVINTGKPPMEGLNVVGSERSISFRMRW